MIQINMNMPSCCLECNLDFDQLWDGVTTHFCMPEQQQIEDPATRPYWCPLREEKIGE